MAEGALVVRRSSSGRRSRAYGLLSERVLSTLSPILAVAIWEAVVDFQLVDRRYIPSPIDVVLAAASLVRSGELPGHIRQTLLRVVLGYLLGAVPAIVVGLTMGLAPRLRALAQPLIYITYPIPKIALFPIVMLFLGLSELSNIAIVAIGVFFPVLYSTFGGVTNIPKIFWDVGKAFSASRRDLFLTVAWPGALPSIFTGLKLGIGMSLVVAVAAEYVAARQGLGFMIWFSWQVLSVGEMFVGIVVIAAVGYALSLLAERLERLVIPWRM